MCRSATTPQSSKSSARVRGVATGLTFRQGGKPAHRYGSPGASGRSSTRAGAAAARPRKPPPARVSRRSASCAARSAAAGGANAISGAVPRARQKKCSTSRPVWTSDTRHEAPTTPLKPSSRNSVETLRPVVGDIEDVEDRGLASREHAELVRLWRQTAKHGEREPRVAGEFEPRALWVARLIERHGP